MGQKGFLDYELHAIVLCRLFARKLFLPEIQSNSITTRLSLPVTVLLEKRLIKRQRWQVPSWYLSGVVIGDNVAYTGRDGEKIRDTASGEEYCWTGFHITFYKDACERYWHALIGDKPLVYVVCREEIEESDLPLQPMVITCDYDEAIAHAETDQAVLSCAIPANLYRYMETFVLEHYRPKAFKKRKRKKWSDESSFGRPV